MKFFFKLTVAFFKRFRVVIILAAILGLGVFFLFEKIIPKLASISETKIGMTGRYQIDELPKEITNKISRGLTSINPDGTPVADLSTFETPDGGITWKFKLKGNIYWQDGKKLTLDDINYEFTDVEISKEGNDTVIYKLKDAFIPFPTVVSKPIFKKGLLGLGEWKVKKLKLNGRYVQDIVMENKDGKKIYYKFYPTEEATKTAFKLGKVDKIIDIINPEPLDKWPTTTSIETANTKQVVTLFFNTQDKFLSDKSVRQALVYAIDKQSLGSRALSPIASDSWAYNPQVKEYAYDTERAKELLKDTPKNVLESTEIKLVTSPLLLDKAESIASYWRSVGINCTVQVSSVVPSEFQSFLTILDLPDDPDQYSLWHSTQTATNISKYSNFRIDKLLEDGRVTQNKEDRRKVYLDFQRYLLEDLPAAFLYNPTYFEIIRK